jgi:HPt (histidine-containing phosphotransfer) domain-containing protein
MVDQELDALRREFLDEARAKVREIESHIGNGSPESRERITYLAHQLKGSGGSYGFQIISTESAEVEKAIETLDGDADQKIRGHIANLNAEIDRRERELA